MANPFHLLVQTYDNFCLIYERLRSELTESPRIRMQSVRINLNSALIALLSMIRFYLDATETKIKREFRTKEGGVSADFKTAQSKEYDGVFEYRFVYKLRNYAQHCNFPLSDIQFNERLSPVTGEKESEFKAYFDRQKLLQEYNGWGSVIKENLKRGPERLEVMEVLQIVMSSMQSIEEAKMRAIMPKLRAYALLIQSLL